MSSPFKADERWPTATEIALQKAADEAVRAAIVADPLAWAARWLQGAPAGPLADEVAFTLRPEWPDWCSPPTERSRLFYLRQAFDGSNEPLIVRESLREAFASRYA